MFGRWDKVLFYIFLCFLTVGNGCKMGAGVCVGGGGGRVLSTFLSGMCMCRN